MDEKQIGADYIKSSQFHGMPIDVFLSAVDKPLRKGDRVELIPVKDGVKVVRIRRETVELGRKMLDGFLEGIDRKK